MGIFDKLSGLIKQEKSEEEKLLIDLKEAKKWIDLADKILAPVGKREITDLEKTAKENFRKMIKKSCSWMEEAEARITIIINSLSTIEQVDSYRKATNMELKEDLEILLLYNKTFKKALSKAHILSYSALSFFITIATLKSSLFVKTCYTAG